MELQQTLRLAIYEGKKANRTFSNRMNEFRISKTNGTFEWSVRSKPMAMGGHVDSGTCISDPVSVCIRDKRSVGVCEVESTRICSKLSSFML